MRGLIFGIAGFLLLASPAFCQVDTLQLVEIGSIEVPAEITDLYVEDLDGDSLKEIILATASNVHIYNGITYEEIWTSPELVNPQDLLFEDINNDGLVDFSAKDSLNIHLLDPHDDAVIWTSPEIDSTYSCYTIGDRNDDECIDVAIVTVESFGMDSDYDTAIVNIIDGPEFTGNGSFKTPLMATDSHEESPTRIEFAKILSGNTDISTIILPTYVHVSNGGFTNGGRIKIYDAMSFNQTLNDYSGYILDMLVYGPQNDSYLYSVSTERSWSGDPVPIGTTTYSARKYSSTSLIDSYQLFGDTYDFPQFWYGFIFDDMLDDYAGPEICYSTNPMYPYYSELKLFSTGNWSIIWTISEYYGNLFPYKYENASICINPLVVAEDYDRTNFINSANGIIEAGTGYIPGLTNISDLNMEGDDEIISIQNDSVFIYHLDVVTSIEDKSMAPHMAFLRLNYPNPFNSTTTIEYSLPEAGHVTIEIYDLLGRKVETLIDEEHEAGTYQVVWDAGDRSSGVYFYRITAGEFAETKRMVLLK